MRLGASLLIGNSDGKVYPMMCNFPPPIATHLSILASTRLAHFGRASESPLSIKRDSCFVCLLLVLYLIQFFAQLRKISFGNMHVVFPSQ